MRLERPSRRGVSYKYKQLSHDAQSGTRHAQSHDRTKSTMRQNRQNVRRSCDGCRKRQRYTMASGTPTAATIKNCCHHVPRSANCGFSAAKGRHLGGGHRAIVDAPLARVSPRGRRAAPDARAGAASCAALLSRRRLSATTMGESSASTSVHPHINLWC